MPNNDRNAGRKSIPNGVRKTYVIPKENVQAVTDLVKSYQDAAILKEPIKKYSVRFAFTNKQHFKDGCFLSSDLINKVVEEEKLNANFVEYYNMWLRYEKQ